MKTKYGNCSKNKSGYYIITSRKEGNYGKYLHRLIYEEEYGSIPQGMIIHHINKNKEDNSVGNLVAISCSEHQSIHRKGRQHSKETQLSLSKLKNTSGYFRVTKHKDASIKQGFLWCYAYYKDGKRRFITSLTLGGLQQKVTSKKLDWHTIKKEGSI